MDIFGKLKHIVEQNEHMSIVSCDYEFLTSCHGVIAKCFFFPDGVSCCLGSIWGPPFFLYVLFTPGLERMFGRNVKLVHCKHIPKISMHSTAQNHPRDLSSQPGISTAVSMAKDHTRSKWARSQLWNQCQNQTQLDQLITVIVYLNLRLIYYRINQNYCMNYCESPVRFTSIYIDLHRFTSIYIDLHRFT